MSSTAHDHRVRFDLPSGTVRAQDNERVVLVPAAALDSLAKSAGVDAACAFTKALGAAVGGRVAAHAGSADAVRKATLETLVTELGAELALAGWGALSLERWGRAMVIAVQGPPLAEQRLLASFVEGAIGVFSGGREVRCLSLGGDGTIRILVAGPRAV